MRFMNVLISIFAIGTLAGCINAREPGASASKLSESALDGTDTIIYSSPDNYLLTLDQVDSSSEVEVRSYKDMFELFEAQLRP
jgi:hypothetical protein